MCIISLNQHLTFFFLKFELYLSTKGIIHQQPTRAKQNNIQSLLIFLNNVTCHKKCDTGAIYLMSLNIVSKNIGYFLSNTLTYSMKIRPKCNMRSAYFYY